MGYLRAHYNNGKWIPILFRPFHEIDGGWFWWTNHNDPSKTVALYKILFDRLKNHHGLHNLIWVWNNSGGATSAAGSGQFYPGHNYADIAGVNIYHIDLWNTGVRQWNSSIYQTYWDILGQIAPGKPRALCEGDGLPHPDKTQNNDPNFVKWLYALAWWAPSDNMGIDAGWVYFTYNHNIYITLDELGTNGSQLAAAGTWEEEEINPEENSVGDINAYPNPSTGEFMGERQGFPKNDAVGIIIQQSDGTSMLDKQIITNENGEGTLILQGKV